MATLETVIEEYRHMGKILALDTHNKNLDILQIAEWLSELKLLRELVHPITDIPKDYCYDTETVQYYCYRNKYTGHEIRIMKPTPIYKIDAVEEVIGCIEQARDKDKNAGEYPYNRCIEIVKEVLGNEVEAEIS